MRNKYMLVDDRRRVNGCIMNQTIFLFEKREEKTMMVTAMKEIFMFTPICVIL